MYARIDFLDTYIPLILPYFLSCNVFSVFLMRSFFNGIPKDLDEAAKIDGCSTFAILYRIILPSTKAVLLIVSTNFVSRVGDPSPLMAMSLLTVIPIMILYAVAQKYFIEGVVTSGLKG